jgi:1-acyl-sn-glycerol-3-phosphate acyltransferase
MDGAPSSAPDRRPARIPSDPRAAERARYLAALGRTGPRQGALDRLVRCTVRAGFLAVGWRVRADGLGALPRGPDGRVAPCVLAVAPHRGWPDPFLVLLAWPHDAPRLAWFGDEVTMTRSWWRRRLLPRLGMIPIAASTMPSAVATYLEAARAALARGCVVVVFAEKGPPSPRGRTRTIAPGAAWLALAGDAPLVPIALGGFLETGLGTRFRVRVLPALTGGPGAGAGDAEAKSGRGPAAAEGVAGAGGAASGANDRARLARDGRAMTRALAEALAAPVADLEAASLRENGRRPLPGLRRLFR